jgi:hypothetical protein
MQAAIAIPTATSLAALGLAGLLFGLGGAAHCAGMCGGFPLALAAAPGGLGARSARVAVYNLGRVTTYMFLALLAGAVGLLAFGQVNLEAALWAARVLSWLVGAAMIVTGLWLLGVPLPLKRVVNSTFLAETVARLTRSITRSRSPFAPLSLGLVNGLLPCPLVYVMLLAALYAGARFGTLIAPLVLGAGFGAGTLPIMMSLGVFGAAVGAGSRRSLLRVTAVLMIVVGALTIARGVPALEPWLHFGHEHHHE